MSSLNDIIQRVKAHPALAGSPFITMADDHFAFVISQLLFEVLNELGGEYASDLNLRHYLISDSATTTVALDGAGVADLATLVTSNGLLLGALQYGNIFHPDNSMPLVPVGNAAAGRLPGNYDAMFLHYWLEGTKLHTRSLDNNQTPLAGNLSFAVPVVPTIAALPPVIDDAVERLVNRLRAMPPVETKA